MSVHTLVIQKRYDDDHSSIMRLDYNESMLIENALSYAMSGVVFKENSHLIKWLAALRAHGSCSIHRRSFAPVFAVQQKEAGQ